MVNQCFHISKICNDDSVKCPGRHCSNKFSYKVSLAKNVVLLLHYNVQYIVKLRMLKLEVV